MYIAFNAPHDPRQSPQEFLDRYPLERIRLPVSYRAEYPYKDAIGCGPALRDEKLAPFHGLNWPSRRIVASTTR